MDITELLEKKGEFCARVASLITEETDRFFEETGTSISNVTIDMQDVSSLGGEYKKFVVGNVYAKIAL